MYTDVKKKEVKQELDRIRLLSIKMCSFLYMSSYYEDDVRFGRDSWTWYRHYFLFSPLQFVINFSKIDREVETIDRLYSYKFRLEGSNVKDSDVIFDLIKEQIHNNLLTDYIIFGKNVISYYEDKFHEGLDVAYWHMMGTTLIKDRLCEMLVKAKYSSTKELLYNYEGSTSHVSNSFIEHSKENNHKLQAKQFVSFDDNTKILCLHRRMGQIIEKINKKLISENKI